MFRVFLLISTFFMSVEFFKLCRFISAQNTPNITKTENPFENLYYWLENINNNPNSSWKAGKNFDFGLPLSYSRKLAGTLPPKGSASLFYKSFSDSDLLEIKKDLPESFDAREKWNYCKSLQEIRDQGDCGSCWAVAAVGVLADRLCIATQGAFNGHISIEDLLTCCNMCGAGCDGGYVDNAWIYLKFVGVVTGGDYNSQDGCMPYSIHPCSHYSGGKYQKCSVEEPMVTPECKHICTNLNYPLPFSEDQRRVIAAYRVEPDVTKIQAELLHHGPVQVVYDVFEDFLSYKSGVYKRTLSPQNRFVGLHAVKLIGWGTDRETGLPYWLVQNSWNVEWGDKGLFKIIRGINDCNFEIDLYAGLPEEEEIH